MVADTDLYFVDDVSCFLTTSRFRAPPNNASNPPPHIFKNLMAATGLGRSYRPGVALMKGADGIRETHINNISGGVVTAPRHRSETLGLVWRKWSSWLVENSSLLDRWSFHIYQIAFALTMEELDEDVEFLPPQTNAVPHIFGEMSTAYAFHLSTGFVPNFRKLFNDDRTLRSEGLSEGMGERIGRLNACIVEATETMLALPSTRDHLDKFLNPTWQR